MTVGLISLAGGTPLFNGGKSQINLSTMGFGGDYPFLNVFKTAQAWAYITGNGPVNPAELDTNGYPIAISNSGVYSVFQVPTQASRPGNYVIKWSCSGSPSTVYCLTGSSVTNSASAATKDATGCIITIGTHQFASGQTVALSAFAGMTQLNGLTPVILSVTPTAIKVNVDSSAFSTYTSGGTVTNSKTTTTTTGRYVFSLNQQTVTAGIQTAGVSNYRICHADDEAALEAGQIFGVQFLARLRQANFGVIRFLNWQGQAQGANGSNITTWATRKSTSYVFWFGYEYRASLLATGVSNLGTFDYGATLGSGAPSDKQTIHIQFSSSPTLPTSAITFTSNTVGQPIEVNWTAHGRSAGEPIEFVATSGGGFLPAPLGQAVTGYVSATGLTADKFQVSLTSGGAVATITVAGSGTFSAIRAPTLNLNSTGTIPIRTNNGDPIGSTDIISTTYLTLTYDALFNAWLMFGSQGSSAGINNGAPPEICLSLCSLLGAHPYFVTPFLAADPATDFMPSLATYLKNNAPPWMIPRFEGINEQWNFGVAFLGTRYGWSKGFIYGYGQFQQNEWQGRYLSVLGQALANVYGLGNLGTKYHVLCGVQSVTGQTTGSANGNDPRLTSAKFISLGPAAPGYIQQEAYLTVSAVCMANYITPTAYNTINEATLAFDYALNATAANPGFYIDTLLTGATGTTSNIPDVQIRYQNLSVWQKKYATGAGFTNSNVNFLFGYEGGYSPDYSNTAVRSIITGATQNNPCILTTATTTMQNGVVLSGNPAIVGMTVTPASIVGMTQLNGNTYTISAINVGADPTKIAINVDATGFTAYGSGGTATYVNAPTYLNNLRYAGKICTSSPDSATGLQGYTFGGTYGGIVAGVNSNYANFVDVSIGGQFPSCFELSGSAPSTADWPVLEDVYQTPDPPQWTAIVTFNH
jgi:Ubiquitin-activating enzyme E1 FCCH domain